MTTCIVKVDALERYHFELLSTPQVPMKAADSVEPSMRPSCPCCRSSPHLRPFFTPRRPASWTPSEKSTILFEELLARYGFLGGSYGQHVTVSITRVVELLLLLENQK